MPHIGVLEASNANINVLLLPKRKALLDCFELIPSCSHRLQLEMVVAERAEGVGIGISIGISMEGRGRSFEER